MKKALGMGKKLTTKAGQLIYKGMPGWVGWESEVEKGCLCVELWGKAAAHFVLGLLAKQSCPAPISWEVSLLLSLSTQHTTFSTQPSVLTPEFSTLSTQQFLMIRLDYLPAAENCEMHESAFFIRSKRGAI